MSVFQVFYKENAVEALRTFEIFQEIPENELEAGLKAGEGLKLEKVVG